MPKIIKEVINLTLPGITPETESWLAIVVATKNGDQVIPKLIEWPIRREQNAMNRYRGSSLFKKQGPNKPKSKISEVNKRLNRPSFKDLAMMTKLSEADDDNVS